MKSNKDAGMSGREIVEKQFHAQILTCDSGREIGKMEFHAQAVLRNVIFYGMMAPFLAW